MNKRLGTYDKIEPLIDLIKLQILCEFSACEPDKSRDLSLYFSITKDEKGKLKSISVKRNYEK